MLVAAADVTLPCQPEQAPTRRRSPAGRPIVKRKGGVRVTARTDPHGSVSIIVGVAQVLADHHPIAWQRLLADHVADRVGHCPACHSHSHGSPVWPCTLRIVAEHAQRISQATGRTPSPGAGDARP